MDVLTEVVTIREAAKMYNYSVHNIRYHLQHGKLTYRKADGGKNAVILIAGASLYALWGKPQQEVSTSIRAIG